MENIQMNIKMSLSDYSKINGRYYKRVSSEEYEDRDMYYYPAEDYFTWVNPNNNKLYFYRYLNELDFAELAEDEEAEYAYYKQWMESK